MSEIPRMTLIEHLAELRSRVVRAFVAVALCAILSFSLLHGVTKEVIRAPLDSLDPHTTNAFARYNPLVNRLRPYLTGDANPQAFGLHAMTAMEKITVKFKLAILCGFVLSAPFVLYQGWSFIGAGLTHRERKAILRHLPLSIALFLAGTAFAYFVAVPVGLLFLLSLDPDVTPVLMYGPYFSLITTSVGLFGVGFQLPLVCMALARLGIVPARTLARNRRYAIVVMFVLGAVLTPPEPFTQCLLAVPLIGLYEFGVLLARLAERRSQAE